ncbi:MAG: radical SAM protein [Deltaproteobacteria bacterium]|nr:radical SAM protein [Deltaproteobacteria bacterium]
MPDPLRRGPDGVQAKITPSLACNNDCRFCYNRLDKREARALSEARVLELVDEAAASGAEALNFIGGEVTILPYFERALARASGRFQAVSINTNGRRFADEHFARRCAALGLTAVDVSLHGSTGAVHDLVSRTPGAWAETTAGLRNLAAIASEDPRLAVSVTTLVLDWNLGDLAATGALVASLGVRAWRLKYAFGVADPTRPEVPAEYLVPFERALPALRRAVEANARALNIQVHDVPTCVLGDLYEFSTVHERHRVARYDEGGLDAVAPVLGRWGETSARCAPCAARDRCGRALPGYVYHLGDGALLPLDEAAFDALRVRAREARGALESRCGAHAAPHEPHALQTLFDALDAHARAGDWTAVREEALRAEALCPGHPEAVRMRRRAEVKLLEAIAERLERHGDRARARRTLALVRLHYGDLVRGSGS